MKLKVFMLIFFAITLLTGCGALSQTASEADKNVLVSVEESQIPGIEIETEIGEYDEYKYALHFPRTESDTINIQIQKFIAEQRNQFIDLTKSAELGGNLFSELNIDFEITHISEPFLSIVFTSNMNIPGTEQTSIIHTLNFNRKTNSVLNIEDLLSNDDSLEYLQKLSEKQLLQDEQMSELVRSNQLTDGISSVKPENYETFSLLDQSLNFYFNSEQFKNINVKTFNVALSYNSLSGIINSSFLQSIYQVASTETALLSETLSAENTLATLDSNLKYVALTFDDGPHKDYTPQILDTLKKYNAKATFYILGNRASYYPDIVKRTYNEGHEIGNHTWSHSNLKSLSQETMMQEINSTSNEIAKITGKMPTTIRPPYGAYNAAVQEYVSMPIILWSVDTLDWKHRNSTQIKQEVQANVTNGSIVLMHDIHQATAEALEDVLISLTKQGYRFVTVSELLQLTDPAVAYASNVYTNK
ncbi:polysaccharide deacetylase family protein [Bacillus sp. AGMB 02131]|uniref:Polysaccharide deacetylase family protein n=1 Tax=Peribacillus faecalis TaxID=2772559 RepID=A0A927CYF4_9BACI|nr:polysaccharide deacetylase family protein [Peribacillus faecalis]MBD3109346.1 polysaccharide deacetylase family protein [Peribacillus faecalis]